jgi:hypothetical protein
MWLSGPVRHGSIRCVAVMRVLGGRYRLLEQLGSGGMSVVWRAYDEVLGRQVAVKLLRPGGPADDGSRARILAEAQQAARLAHPYITSVHDYGESPIDGDDEPTPFVVMELVTGPTLADRLEAGPVPVAESLRICAQVAAALAAAHARGVVHRDIKPANIMLSPSGAKVLDFGIAAGAGETNEAITDGEVWGTPAYLAPERLAGGTVVPASEVYALGLLLYRLLAGELPWEAGTVTEMIDAHRYVEPAPLPHLPGVHGTVREICARCLDKDPAERPAAGDVARMLAAATGRHSRAVATAVGRSGPFGPAEPYVETGAAPAVKYRNTRSGPPVLVVPPDAVGVLAEEYRGSLAGEPDANPAGEPDANPAAAGGREVADEPSAASGPDAAAVGAGAAGGVGAGAAGGVGAGAAGAVGADAADAAGAVGANAAGAVRADAAGGVRADTADISGTAVARGPGTSAHAPGPGSNPVPGPGSNPVPRPGAAVPVPRPGAAVPVPRPGAAVPVAPVPSGASHSRRSRRRTALTGLVVVAVGLLAGYCAVEEQPVGGSSTGTPAPATTSRTAPEPTGPAGPAGPSGTTSATAPGTPIQPGAAGANPGAVDGAVDGTGTGTGTVGGTGGDGSGAGVPGEQTAPAPSPNGAVPTQANGWVVRTFDTAGGTVTGRCAGASAAIVGWNPLPGFVASAVERGPGPRASITFTGAATSVRVTVRCADGVPVAQLS